MRSTLTYAIAVGSALALGGVAGATFVASGGIGPAVSALAATASPSPSPHSNESAAHEKGESAAQEAAENNGTFRPGGPGGPGGHHGPSNESPTHEAGESAAQEAAENT
jgi:hypothetical protein